MPSELADNSANPTQKIPVLGVVATALPPLFTEGHLAPLSSDLAGNLRTNAVVVAGPTTIADGADVAEGSTLDVAWVAGAGTVISLLKKIASAGGSAVTIADGADVAEGTTTDLDTALTVIGRLKKIVALLSAAITVTGPLTDAQLRASAVPVSGPLTDAQLRASAVPISAASLPLPTGAATETTLDTRSGSLTEVAPATDTASSGLNGRLQRVAQRITSLIALLPAALVGGRLDCNTGAWLGSTAPTVGSKTSASSVPVVIASDQGAVPVTAPTLTKGTQSANGWSVQDLKDSGRVNIMWTAEFAHAQTAETLLTITESRDGAATTTFTTKVVTSGKRLRITSAVLEVELLGTGTTPQRAYLRMRFNTAGAVTTGSPIQAVVGCGVTTAIVKATNVVAHQIPDGIEFLGDGTKQIGFSLETPDWVVTTATGRSKITITAFEY